jgi:AcrR family transcriptional regulator
LSTLGIDMSGVQMASSSPAAQQRPKRADVRARLLAAAREIFLANGYRRTNLGDVAARAGFSTGAVYSNFGGKTDLFAEVIKDGTAAMTGSVLASSHRLAAAKDDPTVVREIAAELAAVIVTNSSALTMLAEFRSLAADDPELATGYGNLRRSQRLLLMEDLRRRAADQHLDVDFDEAAATLLLTLVQALAAEHVAAPDAMPRDLVEQALQYAIRGILR